MSKKSGSPPPDLSKSKRRKLSTKYPCIFLSPFVREQVDPRIAAIWEKAPFGNLRRLWRERACAETNPYGSESCPYTTEECAMAFLQTVERTVYAMPRNRIGYFRSVARTVGMERAERKPLAREQERPGHQGGGPSGTDPGSEVRRADRRPVAIGEVLGALTARSHQRSTTHGSESEE